MASKSHSIEGSLLVLNEDYTGASIVIPAEAGRERFQTFRVSDDGVFLVDAAGVEHGLDTSIVDATFAANLGTIVIREMDMETQVDTIPEYGVAIDCPDNAPGPRP